MTINLNFSIRHWASVVPFRHEADPQHVVDDYIEAGLPM
jgi:hypothetical protein